MAHAEEPGGDWSFTKSSLYASCPRAFYFSTELTATDENAKQLPTQKAVNLAALVGIAVHRSIAKQTEKWANGKRLDLREAQAKAEAWLNYVWENADTLIIEAVNGQQLDPGALPRLVSTANECLHTFFLAVWPRFGRHTYLLHERPRNFKIGKHRVSLKVDLCTKDDNNNIVVTDWKTGRTPLLEIDTLQLSVYAMWAMYEHNVEEDKIVVQLVDLKTGEIRSKKPSSSALKETRARILRDCETWARPIRGDFPPTPSFKKCSSCRYLGICEVGQGEVHGAVEGCLH